MSKKQFVLLSFLSLIAVSTFAAPTLQKGVLSYVLPRAVIIFESEKNLPVWLRIVSVKEDGECGEPGKDCPKEELYVVLSDNERLPVHSVTYHIPKAYSWKLESASSCAKSEGDLCVGIDLQEAELNQAGSDWEITEHKYEFRMDSVKEIKQ